MALFGLASMLHKTVAELEEQMTVKEFWEWGEWLRVRNAQSPR